MHEIKTETAKYPDGTI